MSVPGRTGSHTSAFTASGEKFGSTTTVFTPGGAKLRHAAAGLGGLGHGGLGAPDDHDLGLVVGHLEDLLHGVVGHGLVVAAVEELRQSPTGQVALGAAGSNTVGEPKAWGSVMASMNE